MRKRIKNIPKRIMYRLAGCDFADLVQRKFEPGTRAAETPDTLSDVFDCRTETVRDTDFDILNFKSSFHQDLYVDRLHDTTHVSLHFQLGGRSGASITGFNHDLGLENGKFNLMNCVDPVSSFIFPKQQNYEYLCLGLKPEFFNETLEECGSEYYSFLEQSIKKTPFSLFSPNHTTNAWQTLGVNTLKSPPVADSMKRAFRRAKVKELLLFSLAAYGESKVTVNISPVDQEKLFALKAFLGENYLENFTLDLLSRQFMLNEFKLKTGFRLLFQTTVFGYIHQLRMQHALSLLRDSNFSVSEVAAITGYLADSSFIRAFRNHFGISPGKIS